MQQARAQQQGVILMAIHFTTLEIGAALRSAAPLMACIVPMTTPCLITQRRGRERHNADAQAIEREDVRAMLRCYAKAAPFGMHLIKTMVLSKAYLCPCLACQLPQ